jgi:hypothetical protein
MEWQHSKTYPVFTEVSTEYEGMFSTGVTGVTGYRRLITMKAVSKAGTPLIKKYILVMYKDKVSQKWKVLDLSEGTDLELEASSACNLERNNYIDLKYRYRQCGYWSLMAGKIEQAKSSFNMALTINNKQIQTLISPPANNTNSSKTETENQTKKRTLTMDDFSTPTKDNSSTRKEENLEELKNFEISINFYITIIDKIYK